MKKLIEFGRVLFAISLAVFGLQHLIYARGMAGPVPGPPWSPGSPLWAYILGIFLLTAALSLATRIQARWAALLVAAVFFLRAALVYAPRIAASVHDPGPWTSGAEVLSLCGGALVLAGTLSLDSSASRQRYGTPDWTTTLGRYLFAVPLVVFAAQHFLYAHFLAALVTSWIPGHLFWAYFVGVAFLAAALAIVTGKSASFAATMLGLMFLLWVLVLHLARVAAASRNGNEWTSAFVALAMAGSAFALAGTLTKNE
jgi:hypothetical protein